MYATGRTGTWFDLQQVGTDGGNGLPDGDGSSMPDLHHDDDGGDADNNPDAGQQRPHYVTPERMEGGSQGPVE
jgi:hypothetical protein